MVTNTRDAAAVTLKRVLAQPLISDSTPQRKLSCDVATPERRAAERPPRELIVEDAGGRQQAGELGNRAGGPIQDFDELVPCGIVETKHPAVGGVSSASTRAAGTTNRSAAGRSARPPSVRSRRILGHTHVPAMGLALWSPDLNCTPSVRTHQGFESYQHSPLIGIYEVNSIALGSPIAPTPLSAGLPCMFESLRRRKIPQNPAIR